MQESETQDANVGFRTKESQVTPTRGVTGKVLRGGRKGMGLIAMCTDRQLCCELQLPDFSVVCLGLISIVYKQHGELLAA